ncbi:hypothetical protein MTO96_022714 [Rhipicephalus appendiculatus]
MGALAVVKHVLARYAYGAPGYKVGIQLAHLLFVAMELVFSGLNLLAANQQHAGTTPNSMPLLRLQTASTRSPKSPGPPTPFPTPKPLARRSRSLASNNLASLLKQYP